MRKERGVTLIVLILTIVIMLILLTVGIRYISGSNLIGRAENTVNKTNNQTAQEQLFSNELMGRLNEEEGKTDKNNNKEMINNLYEENVLIYIASSDIDTIQELLQRSYELTCAVANMPSTDEDRKDMINEIKELFQEIDRIANETEIDRQKLFDGTFNKAVGIKEIILQIDDLRLSGLGLDITTIDTNLGSPESAVNYADTIQEALIKVMKNKYKMGYISNALYYLQDYYEQENDIIDSATTDMDKSIAKAALTEIETILLVAKNLISISQDETDTVIKKADYKHEMDTYLIAIDHIANNADFNGQKLLDGTFENISKINTTTLGGGTKLPTDISTEAEAEATKAKYQKAIEMIEQEIAKLEE